jgi:phytoene dehydrogenase-like protein
MGEVSRNGSYDALVVGAGPNGLAAAIALARAGYSVLVREARDTCGGGARSAELTLPGFTHDVCSAVYPLAVGSPFFRTLPLSALGLKWVHPQVPLAHPLDDGSAVVLHRSLNLTGQGLGADGAAYQRLFEPLANRWDELQEMILRSPRLPRSPILLARFGFRALLSATTLARRSFKQQRARALFAGLAAHSFLPLELPVSAAFGLVLGAAGHAVGWPVAGGGAQKITDALVQHFRSLGGKIEINAPVHELDDLPRSRVILFDITPRQLSQLGGSRFPERYSRKLQRFRYGPGAFKIDWALDAPVPWTARECSRAATVHLGGTFEEIAASERAAWVNDQAVRPFVLLAQPSLFDAGRAPHGKHTVWAYCHVPNGSKFDMTERIESQIERFAPGFRDRILARSVMSPARFEAYNPNLIGGDINGGVQDLRQLFTRPTKSLYSTPLRGLYLCSSSTPPGGGVHGMCGCCAAEAAVKVLRSPTATAKG